MVMLEARGDLGRSLWRSPRRRWAVIGPARYVDAEYATLERACCGHGSGRWRVSPPTSRRQATGSHIAWPISRSSCCVTSMATARISNVCSHRGSTVRRVGQAADGHLRCGYHGWRYDLDGRCGRSRRNAVSASSTATTTDAARAHRRVGKDGVRHPAPDGMPSMIPDRYHELAPFALGERVCTFRCTLAMHSNVK